MKAGVILRVQPGRVVGEFVRSRALSRLNREQQREGATDREPLHGRLWLDSARAVKCAEEDCGVLFEADDLPCPCPRCGNRQAVPVGRLLNSTVGWQPPETEVT